MKRKNKLQGITIFSLVAVLVGIGLFLFVNNQQSLSQVFGLTNTKQTTTTQAKPTIALVNEDTGAVTNSNDYHFGSDFIKVINNSNNAANYQVLSRAVANKAFQDGSVQAVIYLPTTFSRDILTFNTVKPTQSLITYQVQDNNPITINIVQNLLSDFNSSITKTYASSIADNISSGVHMIDTVAVDQQNLLTSLKQSVQPSLDVATSSYQNVSQLASNLKEVNSSTISQQNEFTKNTVNTLQKIGSDVSAQLPDIATATDVQKQLANSNVQTANDALKNNTQLYQSLFSIIDSNNPKSTLSQFSNHSTDISNTLSALTTRQKTATDQLTVQIAKYQTKAETDLASLSELLLPTTSVTDSKGNITITHQKPTLTLSNYKTSNTNNNYPSDQATQNKVTGLIVDITNELQVVSDFSDSTQSLISDNPSEILKNDLSALNDWYGQLANEIVKQQDTYNSQHIDQLSVQNYVSNQTTNNKTLYVDTNSPNQLSTSLNSLVVSSTNDAKNVTQQSNNIEDNSDSFNTLVNSTNQANTSNSQANNAANSLIADNTSKAATSNTFKNNFSQLLANTRTPGLNANNVYSVFANPLLTKNLSTSPEVMASQSTVNAAFVFLVLIFGVVMGMLLTLLGNFLFSRRKA